MPAIYTPLPPAESFRETFDYMPDSGLFIYKRPLHRIVLPSKAGTGYVLLKLGYRQWSAHRVAWLLQHGEDPAAFQVDHINGVRYDNRIANLRLCDGAENHANSKVQVNNVTGVKGCHWDKSVSKWQVQIQIRGKRKHVGYFKNLQDADIASLAARNFYHGQFARHT